MHGFLNVFLAAAVAKIKKPDIAVTLAILAGEDPAEFRFSEEVVGWKEHMITTTDLALVRESFALSFGSCSFDEPVEDLKAAGVAVVSQGERTLTERRTRVPPPLRANPA